MLIIISDVHLGDGTCGRPISGNAFRLFGNRLQELAENASWRADGTYRPVDEINVLLLGDILDALHSTLWLDTRPDAPDYTRPWTDFTTPGFAEKLLAITRDILTNNHEAAEALRKISEGRVVSLPPSAGGKPDETAARLPVPARIFYMVGNHDWYYHLPGPAFDAIRKEIIESLGLANGPGPFPSEAEESGDLMEMLTRYKVYARHGDFYDGFNFNREKGRDAYALGDIFTVEMMNRFPVEAKNKLGMDIPPVVFDGLREMTNVRPVLAAPLWISSQITHNDLPRSVQDELKAIWDGLGEEFLAMDVVRAEDLWLKPDSVDALQVLLKISKRTPFATLNKIILRLRRMMGNEEISYSENALKETAFKKGWANYVVFGHTHHHEVLPLDTLGPALERVDKFYFNSGTWHTYFGLALNHPEEQKFVPYQEMTYLAFYHEGERRGRRFETWSGAFA